MRALLFYNSLRLLIFAAVFAMLYVAGARTLALWGLAILISGVISLFALAPQRAAMAGEVSRRYRRFRRRLDAGAAAEDQD